MAAVAAADVTLRDVPEGEAASAGAVGVSAPDGLGSLTPERVRELRRLARREARARARHLEVAAELRAAVVAARDRGATVRAVAEVIERSPARVHQITELERSRA